MNRIEGLIIDLDGTLYHGGRAIAGANEALERLKHDGIRGAAVLTV